MKQKVIMIVSIVMLLMGSSASWAATMRRPLSPTQPMWLVHIDNSYGEDAQQCIDAIPADVRPYVVFNLAITNSEDNAKIAQWLAVCQQNDVWAMVQCSAGTRNSMSTTDITQYEQFYQDYSCLIGYNFCEQNWGFDDAEGLYPLTTQLELYCKLLELAHTYGGYLYINDSQSISNNPINTIAKMKKSSNFPAYSKTYADHLIFGDKTTMGYGYYDNESACLGMFLSGHAGYYAMRYDQYSWSYSGRGPVFGTETPASMNNSLAWFSCPEAVMGMPIVEHMMMTGATVIDGPEIPIISCLYGGKQTPAFKNMICDIMRKVVDGTIRIPTRQQVLDRTKVCMVLNSYNTVGDDTPLYEGLYQMDGHRKENKTWLKKSGRYATIPTVATMDDAAAFDIKVAQKSSNLYTSRWATTDAKVTELNALYPEVSTGDMYVGRMQNLLLAYNPYVNTDQNTTASVPLQYNTCSSLSLDYPAHTFSVVTEQSDGISIYLNNYRTDKSSLWTQYPNTSYTTGGVTYGDNTAARMTQYTVQQYVKNTFIDNPVHNTLRLSVITITGCTAQPTYTLTDRSSHAVSSASASYAEGTWTLTVSHNGPVDLDIQCAGSNTNRLDVPTYSAIAEIPTPSGVEQEAPMEISTVDDWKAYAAKFSNGSTTAYNARLMNDLDLGTDQTMIDYFCGTFDGQGHTLTVAYNATADICAPFRRVVNGGTAIIKNLHTKGTITTTKNFPAGILGGLSGTDAGTILISGCSSSIDMQVTATTDARAGGIVGRANNATALTVSNCAFTGSISGEGRYYSGLVGYATNSTATTVQNCFVAPTLTSNHASKSLNVTGTNISGCTKSNIYYYDATSSLNNSSQGGTSCTFDDMIGGKIAYTLQQAQTDATVAAWGQARLNTSTQEVSPMPSTNLEHQVIALKVNNTNTTLYANAGGAMPNAALIGALCFSTTQGGNIIQTVAPSADGTIYRNVKKYLLTVGEAGVSTFVLPVAATIPNGVTAYTLNYSTGSTVTATPVTGTLPANTPVLIHAEAGDYEFATENTEVISYTFNTYANGALNGVYKTGFVPADSYVLQQGDSGLGFYKVTAANGILVSPFHAWLTAEANNATFLSIQFNDNPTGIRSVVNSTLISDDCYYDLQGRKYTNSSTLKPGIYVRNGKKYIVK